MDNKTREVQEWWDKNPFTLGVAGDYNKGDLVGRIPYEKMNLQYFEEINRRFRKHSGIGAQKNNEPLLSKLVDYTHFRGMQVLDIATGSGIFATVFAEVGAKVTAIDLTQFAVVQANRNFEMRHLVGEVRQMDAQCLDFSDESFDFVNAWGCLMHMPDTQEAINEIYRVLKPSGKTLAYMYNKSSWPFWFNIFFLRGILLGGLIRYRGNITRLTSRYSDGTATGGNMLTKFYAPKEAQNMFIKAGLKNVVAIPWDIGYEPNHWPVGKFPIFRFFPQVIKKWLSKNFGYGLIITADK